MNAYHHFLIPLLAIIITTHAKDNITLLLEHYQNASNNEKRFQIGNELLNLGNREFNSGNIEQALEIFNLLSKLFPYSAAIYHNIGFALAELNKPDQAIGAYKQALMLKPEDINIKFGLALVELAAGNYPEAFTLYETRWQKAEHSLLNLPFPIWQGEALDGKTILLRSEGSLGDAIQFIRYAQCVKELGAYVIVQIPQILIPLLNSCTGIDEFMSEHGPLPHADYQISLLSLPDRFKTSQETIPNEFPYIHPAPELITYWQTFFDDYKTTFNIGICWQADPANDANRPPIAIRSIPLRLFAWLTKIPGVQLFSIQNIDGLDQISSLPTLQTFGNDIDKSHGRFMDTAAIMHHLDLIISVDTSIAHLAGALGKPIWLLLPYKADWRWMVNRNDSPWYPTMKIFRRGYKQDWELTVHEVEICVRNMTNKKFNTH